MGFDGRPFSTRTFEKWKALGYNPGETKALIHVAQTHLETLLQAAIGPTLNDTPHLFREVLVDLNEFIFDRVKRLKLMPVIEASTRARHPKRQWKTTVEDLRRQFGKHPVWKAKDNPAWKDYHHAVITVSDFTLFEPFMTFGTRAGMPAFMNLTSKTKWIFDLAVRGERFRIVLDQHETNFLRELYRPGVPRPKVKRPSPQSSPPRPRSPVESPKSAKRLRASRARGSA